MRAMSTAPSGPGPKYVSMCWGFGPDIDPLLGGTYTKFSFVMRDSSIRIGDIAVSLLIKSVYRIVDRLDN